MQLVTENVAIEKFTGVVVGAIGKPHGLIYIDAPFVLDESRIWRASLMRFAAGGERLIVALDMNPDRMLGVRNMDAPLLAHQVAQAELDSRAMTYKADESIGLYVEKQSMSGAYRWPQVELGFDEQMALYWDDTPIWLTYAPGVRPDAIWVTLPEEKIVFVGDAVVHREPPFLAHANIPLWLETLNRLLDDDYRGYKIISGRDGVLTRREVRSQISRLERMATALENLDPESASSETMQMLAEKLMRYYAPRDESEKDWFVFRLRRGLELYYLKHGEELNG